MPRLNVYRHDILEQEFIEVNRWRERDKQYGEVTIIRAKALLPNGRISRVSRYFYMDGEAFAPMTYIGQIEV